MKKKKKLFKKGNSYMNESGENALFRKNGVPKFQTHEMEKEGDTDLPTFSEAPEISSKIYDNILELDSLTSQSPESSLL